MSDPSYSVEVTAEGGGETNTVSGFAPDLDTVVEMINNFADSDDSSDVVEITAERVEVDG